MKLDEFDQRAAELSPDEIEMKSELELSMYRITEWELVIYNGEYTGCPQKNGAMFLGSF